MANMVSALHSGLIALGSASHRRLTWGLLALTAAGLLVMAFYYQYLSLLGQLC